MKQLSDAGVQGIIQFQGTLVDPQAVCDKTPAGVPVLAVEFAQPPCAKTLVSADDLRAGQIAGHGRRASGSRTSGAARTTRMSRSGPRSPPIESRLRMEGYCQGFSAVCPITNEQIGRAIDTQALAKTAMTSLLATLPGKSRIVVVDVNDDAALGALDAATAANRQADVWVSGQGAEARVRDLIRSNPQYIGDSAYFPERYGTTIVPALLDLIAGKTVQPLLLIEPAWVDATNIDQVYPR